jgi:hypothetical protein
VRFFDTFLYRKDLGFLDGAEEAKALSRRRL